MGCNMRQSPRFFFFHKQLTYHYNFIYMLFACARTYGTFLDAYKPIMLVAMTIWEDLFTTRQGIFKTLFLSGCMFDCEIGRIEA